GANSSEFDANAPDPVVIFMPKISRTRMTGAMRLGLRPTIFQAGTERARMRCLYAGAGTVWEHHRHCYKVNPAYVEHLQKSGMDFIGKDEKGERMHIMELPTRPDNSSPHGARSHQ
ncbi:hypothetical protein FA95DRAFT_1501156, partial [Auriscalpium vulgare]